MFVSASFLALSEFSNELWCVFRHGRGGGGRLVLLFYWRAVRLGWRLEAFIGVALVDLVLSQVTAKLSPLLFDAIPDDVVHLVWNKIPGVVAWERWHTG